MSQKSVIGLDVGGTKIFAGRYESAQLIKTDDCEIPTEAAAGKDTILGNLITAINQVKTSNTTAIGISWAGFVNNETGTINNAPNISALNGFNLTQYITQQTGLTCLLENDARCFALGAYENLPEKPKVFLGIIIGTGVGGGLINHGKIFQGENHAAGEVGHILINGQEIEAQIAGPALEKKFGVTRLSQLDRSTLTDDQIQKIINPLIDWLTILCFAYNPGIISIGGGAGQHFWRHYQSQVTQQLSMALGNFPCQTKIVFADHENAGAQGAAALVKQYL